MAKPTIPEVIDRFRAYHVRNPVWGALHVVLDDCNFEDSSVEFCANWAREVGDQEGEQLALILRQMSRTQRAKLAWVA